MPRPVHAGRGRAPSAGALWPMIRLCWQGRAALRHLVALGLVLKWCTGDCQLMQVIVGAFVGAFVGAGLPRDSDVEFTIAIAGQARSHKDPTRIPQGSHKDPTRIPTSASATITPASPRPHPDATGCKHTPPASAPCHSLAVQPAPASALGDHNGWSVATGQSSSRR